jgi:hypothetical protein
MESGTNICEISRKISSFILGVFCFLLVIFMYMLSLSAKLMEVLNLNWFKERLIDLILICLKSLIILANVIDLIDQNNID